ncbi:MAG: Maf family nucleotide pyrophosphatase [Alphaproteobacteria bacterium]
MTPEPERSSPSSAALVLASASPRRRDLLRQIGLSDVEVVEPVVDEAPLAGELPRQTAVRLALAKATTVAGRCPGRFVLAADTVVAKGRRALGKSEDEGAARLSLGLLSGGRHRVHTAVCVISPSGAVRQRVVTTIVTFKRLSDGELLSYLASQEWRGKAGAYAIQGRAAAFVRFLSGSYSGVVGLPLHETAGLLHGMGLRW